jgi:hypothetical protein
MSKKILFLILLGILALPCISYAQSISGMVDAAVGIAVDIIAGVVVIFWIITAILFLSAQGDPGKLKTARTALITSVAGTVIALIAQGAASFVGGALHIS